MVKWIVQADSAHQVGLKTTLHTVLIAGYWCCTRWWRNFGAFGDVLANLQQPAELWTNGCETHSSNSTCCNSTHSSLQLTILYTVLYTVLCLHGDASRYFNSSYFNLLHRTFSPNRCVLYFSKWIVIVVVDIFNCLCLYFSSSFPWFRCRTTPAANATPARKQERRQEDYDFIFFVSIATTKCPAGAVCGLIYNFYIMLQTPMPGRTRGS